MKGNPYLKSLPTPRASLPIKTSSKVRTINLYCSVFVTIILRADYSFNSHAFTCAVDTYVNAVSDFHSLGIEVSCDQGSEKMDTDQDTGEPG